MLGHVQIPEKGFKHSKNISSNVLGFCKTVNKGVKMTRIDLFLMGNFISLIFLDEGKFTKIGFSKTAV